MSGNGRKMKAQSDPTISGTQRRILVVDDEVMTRKVIIAYLARGGYAVQAVESGEEALQYLSSETFDLVLTDNSMPVMSGVELAGAIKAIRPGLPVVMFSGNPPERPVACLDLVLHKPGDIPCLLPSVERPLGG